MFVELLITYECYLPIAQKLGIPVIGTVASRSGKVALRSVGVPDNPAVIPLENTHSKPEMSLVERIGNVWNNMVIDYYYQTNTRVLVEKFYRESFAEDLLYKKEVSLVFVNNHASFLPRPSISNAIEVGGIHVKPANPLPDVSQFAVPYKSLRTFLYYRNQVYSILLFPCRIYRHLSTKHCTELFSSHLVR